MLLKVRELNVLLPRARRTRTVARSASASRTMTTPRLALALNRENEAAAQLSNVAVTSVAADTVREHGWRPEQAPPQARKRERPLAVARKVTCVPWRKPYSQVLPQSIPVGCVVIVPAPCPF